MTFHVAKKLGGSLNPDIFLLFSDTFLITVSGTMINIHDISTKTLIKSYEYHDFPIKSLALFEDSSKNREIFSVDASGLIKSVNFRTDVTSFSFHLRETLICAVFCRKLKKIAYKPASLRATLKFFDFFTKEVQLFHYESAENPQKSSEAAEDIAQGLVLSADEGYLLEFHGKSVIIFEIFDEISKKNVISHDNLVTCVALRPDNSRLAVGDCLGKIYLYYEPVRKSQENVKFSKFHWHCRPVLCVKFNEFSNVLMSGGFEVNFL